MEKKLTDEEIVKAHEWLVQGDAYFVWSNGIENIQVSAKETLDLIQRQKAEIERLTEELEKAYEIERANIQAEIAEAGTSCHWCKQQAVKDTAKEIEQELEYKGEFEYGRFSIRGSEFMEIFKKRGVEVE